MDVQLKLRIAALCCLRSLTASGCTLLGQALNDLLFAVPVLSILCRPDKDRFHRPYVHSMSVPDSSGATQQLTVTIKQQKFGSEGFASTGVAGCYCCCYMVQAKAMNTP
jgi:uncharacterized protein YegL